MKKILKKVAEYVRENAIEGAGKPSVRFAMESKAPEVLRTASEKKENKE